MKKLIILSGAAMALSACSSSSSSDKPAVPKFDSLAKITPKISTEILEKMKVEADRVKSQAEVEKIQADRKLLVAEIEAANLEKTQVTAEIIDTQERIVVEQANLVELQKLLKQESSKKALQKNDVYNKQMEVVKADLKKVNADLVEMQKRKEQQQSKIVELKNLIKSSKENIGILQGAKDKLYGVAWALEYVSGSLEEEILEKQTKVEGLNSELKALSEVYNGLDSRFVEGKARQQGILNSMAELARQSIGQTMTGEPVSGKLLRTINTKEVEIADLTQAELKLLGRVQILDEELTELGTQLEKLSNTVVENTGLSEFQMLKLSIVEKINSGKRPSVSQLIDAVIARNIEAKGTDTYNLESLKVELKELVSTSEATDAHSFKVSVEEQIATKYHSNSPMRYNMDAYHLQDPLVENRVQCYSGTNLYAVTNELRMNPQENMVFIYERGHVLPGFIEARQSGLFLVGIEMTAAGKARVEYGATRTLGGQLRVLDAHQVMLMEVLGNTVSNLQAVVTQMQDTMKIYGVDPSKMMPMAFGVASTSEEDKKLNQSMFGFGKSDVEPGDQARDPIDIVVKLNFQMTSSAGTDSQAKSTREPDPRMGPAVACEQLIYELEKAEKFGENPHEMDYGMMEKSCLTIDGRRTILGEYINERRNY